MKTFLLSAVAAVVLFAASSSFAAPVPPSGNAKKYDSGKEYNYGYPKGHRVSAAERARWEAAHRTNRHDARFDQDFNYGYPSKHKVTAKERARWEAAHRNDRRR